MASIKALYDLIHTLDKREKITVNLFIQSLAGKSKSSYLTIYKHLNGLQTFDRAEIIHELTQLTGSGNISETNTNLYQFILTAVNFSNLNRDKKLGLLNQISKAEVLYKKNLTDQALKTIASIEADVVASNQESLIIYLKKLESKVLLAHEKNKSYEKRIAISEELAELSAQAQLKHQMDAIEKRFFQLAATIGTPRTQAQIAPYLTLSNEPIFKKNFKTIPDLLLPNFVKTKVHLLMASYSDAETILKIALSGYAAIKKRIDLENNLPEYYSSCRMMIDVAILTSNEPLAKKYLNEFKSLGKKINLREYTERYRIHLHSSFLMYYVLFEKVQEGISYIKRNKLEPEAINKGFLGDLAYIMHLYCARLFFTAQRFEESLAYSHQLITAKAPRDALVIHIYTLYLLTHYKLGNETILPYLSRSMKARLNKKDKMYAPEKALLSFLKKADNPFAKKSHLKVLLNTFKKLKEDPLHGSFFTYGNYITWIETELNNPN